MPLPSTPHALPGLRAVVARYDAFLVDLHGVVHDGEHAFDGAVPALRELAAAGRRVIFLTNSSRAGAMVRESLAAMAIGRELYEAVISSGDVTREALVARDPALFAALPAVPRWLHIGEPAYVPWLFEMDLAFVDAMESADAIFATGAVRDEASLARVRALLEPAAMRGLPLVCTNPDRIIPTARGLTLGPGAIAAAYESLGGRVFLYGKPHAPIYAAARRQLNAVRAVADDRVLAIGDLLETDVRGARAAGLASALVTGTGGHADVLGDAPEPAAFDALLEEAGIAPDLLLPRFAW